MRILIQGGRIIDPSRDAHAVEDLLIDDDRIGDAKSATADSVDHVIDASGCVVMAGAIDIHTHIGGGKLSIARMLLSDTMAEEATRLGRGIDESSFLPSTEVTARRYLEMGYTVAFEPAVIPCNARAAHSEMADLPGLATGGFCLLGNDDLLLRLIAEDAEQVKINQYVAWMVRATQCIAVKVVNAGGISAFKFGVRRLDVNTPHPEYGVTPGQVIRRLARAVHEIGLVHPLHVHCSNLGIPGNIESTLATIEAAGGYRLHLTHAQFHSYGKSEKLGMSSAAERLARAINANPNVTIDVGQVLFGQTVTISADAAHQFQNRNYATPKKSALVDIECEAGCGVVPFKYRRKQFVNALQWAIGLELFLMIENPAQVFLTTDHPNGAPFTAYPHLIRLLTDRSFRETALAEIHVDAAASSSLGGMDRQYTLEEIAVMTRSAPARIMGLSDRGILAKGSRADVVVYPENSDHEAMFRKPRHVFADGRWVIRDGKYDRATARATPSITLTADIDYDTSYESEFRDRYADNASFAMNRLRIGQDEMESLIGTRPVRQANGPAALRGDS
ncbi:MAG: formylmethanofuran dehydrogenase subunit A [Planctomycetota bacterium]